MDCIQVAEDMLVFCEHSYETWGCINRGFFFEWLSNDQLLRYQVFMAVKSDILIFCVTIPYRAQPRGTASSPTTSKKIYYIQNKVNMEYEIML